MKVQIFVSLLVGAAALAGCSTTDSTDTTSMNPTYMSASEMTQFCRGEGAERYSTRPASINVAAPLPGVGGGFIVTGSADQGAMGNAPFECRFGPAGDFIELAEL